MLDKYRRLFLASLIGAVIVLFACQTAELIANLRATPTRRPPTRVARPATTPLESIAEGATSPRPTPTRDPNAQFPFATTAPPSCSKGDNTESSVSGVITAKGQPLAGILVQGSAGPGGEPISEFPAESNDKGEYKVTFVCNGKACNGAFWIWIVDKEFRQMSPFIQFIFDDNCRRAQLNFERRR